MTLFFICELDFWQKQTKKKNEHLINVNLTGYVEIWMQTEIWNNINGYLTAALSSCCERQQILSSSQHKHNLTYFQLKLESHP